MTAALDLNEVLNDAEKFVYSQDTHRDCRENHRRVQILTAAGFSADQIAMKVGLSQRQVVRLRTSEASFPEPPHPPAIVDEPRAEQLDGCAEFVLKLACRLRDENPALVYETLRRLPIQQLVELAMVALAGIPLDRTVSEVWSWVEELGEV